LIEHTLLKVPEIQEEYDQNVVWYDVPLSEEAIKKLDEIAKKHNIPQTSGPIGPHIVFEDIFVKFVVSIANQKPMERRLIEILQFVEELATHPDIHIQNVIAVSFCEPLATTHRSHCNAILPYMGSQTTCFFQEMAEYFWGKDNRLWQPSS
jgi:hypothetical protein